MQFFNQGVPDLSITTAKLADDAVTDAKAAIFGRSQLFTSSGNFTAPKAGTYLVMCIAGGGGGGQGGSAVSGTTNGGTGGQGGGGGSLAVATVALTKGEVVPVTIGAGGIGGSGTTTGVGSSGASGTDTTFGAYVTAIKGRRGVGGSTLSPAQTGGTGGANGGGMGGGVGGNVPLVSGTGDSASNGVGIGSGGGGGGGAYQSDGSVYYGGVGGNGADGACIVIWP